MNANIVKTQDQFFFYIFYKLCVNADIMKPC